MNRVIFNLLLAIFLWLGSCCIVTGQVAQSDQITDAQQQIIQADDTSNGKFQPVTVDPGATSAVELQFPTGAAGKEVLIQPLDGGTTNPDTATIDETGLLTFSFCAGNPPGIYPVFIIDPNAPQTPSKIIGVLQFVVPNPP